jgi:hypothetical protein
MEVTNFQNIYYQMLRVDEIRKKWKHDHTLYNSPHLRQWESNRLDEVLQKPVTVPELFYSFFTLKIVNCKTGSTSFLQIKKRALVF